MLWPYWTLIVEDVFHKKVFLSLNPVWNSILTIEVTKAYILISMLAPPNLLFEKESPVFGKLFVLFAVLPILEIALLINIGEQIGGWNTVAIVIFTAFVGAYLVRREGISTLMQAQQKMQTGAMPGQEMAEGLLLVIAGVLLVTPGFITDGLGFLLSFPLTRPLIAKSVMKQITVGVMNGQNQSHSAGFHYHSQTQNQSQWQQARTDEDVIEGEYVNQDDVGNNKRLD